MTCIDPMFPATLPAPAFYPVLFDEPPLYAPAFALPGDLRRQLERLFRTDFSAVRIMFSPLPESCGAQAFARGADIHVKPGYYAPQTRHGLHLLAHELAHVVQQRQGRTSAPPSHDACLIDDPALEREADDAANHCTDMLFGPAGGARACSMPQSLLLVSAADIPAVYRYQPIQCITSAVSYQAFKTDCWTYLSGFNNTAIGNLNHRTHMRYLYNNVYSAYNGHNILQPAKVALAGNALYQEMTDLLDATDSTHNDNIIRIQTGSPWPQLVGDGPKQAITAQYQQVIAGLILPAALTANAAAATNHYLHIYTNPRRAIASNWRIGLNVPPSEMADAVTALMPIMQANANINHIKFAAPGMAGKPDSVIVYMRRDPLNLVPYTTTENAVTGAINAVNGFNVVQQFSPMWDELSPGIAVAAEPPVGGGSFGNFRCILAYQAYLLMRKQRWQVNWGPNNYGTTVDALFTHFGIPAPNNTYEQNALVQPFFNVRGCIFTGLKAIYDGTSLTNR